MSILVPLTEVGRIIAITKEAHTDMPYVIYLNYNLALKTDNMEPLANHNVLYKPMKEQDKTGH